MSWTAGAMLSMVTEAPTEPGRGGASNQSQPAGKVLVARL